MERPFVIGSGRVVGIVSGNGSGISTENVKKQTSRNPLIKSWRIEINTRKRSGKTYRHWNYTLTLSNGKRKRKYGGQLSTLPDPKRYEKYKKNAKKAKKRKGRTNERRRRSKRVA